MDFENTVSLKVDEPVLPINELKISFDEKATRLIHNKSYPSLRFEIELIEEACARIYNPIIIVNNVHSVPAETQLNIIQISDPFKIKIEITPLFSKIFPELTDVVITGSGWIRKSLNFEKIEPKIINICKK